MASQRTSTAGPQLKSHTALTKPLIEDPHNRATYCIASQTQEPPHNANWLRQCQLLPQALCNNSLWKNMPKAT